MCTKDKLQAQSKSWWATTFFLGLKRLAELQDSAKAQIQRKELAHHKIRQPKRQKVTPTRQVRIKCKK